MSSSGSEGRVPKTFEELCNQFSSYQDLYIKNNEQEIKSISTPASYKFYVYWGTNRQHGYGGKKGEKNNKTFRTYEVIDSTKLYEYKVDKYKPLFGDSNGEQSSFRNYCKSINAQEAIVKSDLKSEISKRDIALAAGIPSVAVLAAGGGTTL